MNLVLLPGLDGTGELFMPFIETLPKDINALVISYPGNIKLSYEELVEFVLNQLPDNEFILVGESFSGYIAHQIALRNPKNMKAVIFVASFLENPRPLMLGISGVFPRRYIFSGFLPEIVIKVFLFGMNVCDQIISLFRQSMKQVSPDVLVFRLIEISKISGVLQSCSLKATYIQASNDKLVPKKCADAFKKAYKDICVFEVHGPHFILQSNPVSCLDVIINEYDL
jgi:pimeloyl-ACP methyl ester carboxylesterase